MAITFRINTGLHLISRWEERDLDLNPLSSGVVGAESYTWNVTTDRGLYLEIEPMPLETYTAAPLKRGPIGREASQAVTRVQMGAQVTADVLKALSLNPGLLRGATVVIRRTYLELDQAEQNSYRTLFKGVVTTWESDNGGGLSIEVSDRWFDWESTVAKRLYSKNCGFQFKGARCGYSGPETFCDKSLVRCSELGNQANFGGFPAVPDLQFKGVGF